MLKKQKIPNKKILSKINKKLFPKLKNKSLFNDSIIITFSGVPGAGKTTLAKILEERYDAVRINNAVIREIIEKQKLADSEDKRQELFQEYNFYLLENMPFANKRIILDKSMDRRYLGFMKVCKNKRIKYFIIRLHLEKEEDALKRLSRREKIVEHTRISMKRWFKEYHDCVKNLKADVTLDAKNQDLKKLFKKLDEAIIDKK